MKVIPIALAPQYAGAGSTLCSCLKITRADSTVVGFTSLDAPLTVSGVLYRPGFEPGDIVSTAGLEVGNLDLTILPDAPGGLFVEYPDLIAGLYDNAAFEIFEVNWKSPTDGVNLLKRGTMGEAKALQGSFTIELRGLTQALQQPVGAVTSKNCRSRFGDEGCTLDLADFTFDYTLTSVTSRRVVTASAAVEASDYYGDGILVGLTGANAKYSRKIKSFAAGVFTLALELPFTAIVGDTIRVTAGCRLRLIEDCKTKFGNVLNFQGEPHLPGIDLLTADPDVGGGE